MYNYTIFEAGDRVRLRDDTFQLTDQVGTVTAVSGYPYLADMKYTIRLWNGDQAVFHGEFRLKFICETVYQECLEKLRVAHEAAVLIEAERLRKKASDE